MFKVEKEGEYNGYMYVIIFQDRGFRCGYVGLDKSNPLYGSYFHKKAKYLKKSHIENDEIGKRGIVPLVCAAFSDDDSDMVSPNVYFNVHGGITYSDGGKDSVYPIKSNLWWYGFDCGHAGDGQDFNKALEYGLLDKARMELMKNLYADFGEPVRELDYVEQECKNLIDQIINVVDR